MPNQSDEKFCDIVMKGGITSSIVYPKVVAQLAVHWSFKNIGSTSARAIAGAATTAALYGKPTKSKDSFAELTDQGINWHAATWLNVPAWRKLRGRNESGMLKLISPYSFNIKINWSEPHLWLHMLLTELKSSTSRASCPAQSPR